MSTQYTPGEWHTEMPVHTLEFEEETLLFAGEKPIAIILGGYSKNEIEPEELRANAQLIAAAPELLECLIEWLEMSGVDPFQPNSQGYSKQTVKAINAIQKAKGGSDGI
jgi:hypothetical protein